MALTADTRTRLQNEAERIGRIGSQGLARAVAETRRLWTHQDRPEDQTSHLRWGAAALLVLVGVVSALVVPRAPDAMAASPEFDRASVARSADPPAAVPVATAVGPTAAPTVQPVNVALPLKPTIPVGKGMWIHILERASAGNIQGMVEHAVARGLSHVYLRLGSSRMGFYAQQDLNKLLPAAHAAGLKVIGWDFPYLRDPYVDAERAAQAVAYVTPDGHRIDGFSADIETSSEGTTLTTDGVRAYGIRLRQLVGPQTLLIAAVPRPNPKRWYPYETAVANFDAIAPMVYWVNRDPATDVAGAIQALAPLGKPIIPVGQAYDPAIDGSDSWAPPSAGDINKFMQTAADLGVASFSFWAWDTANDEQWQAIASSQHIQLRPLLDGPDLGERVVALQRVLKGLGHPVAVDGNFGAGTKAALAEVQRQMGLPMSGQLDKATLKALKHPR